MIHLPRNPRAGVHRTHAIMAENMALLLIFHFLIEQ